MTSVTPYVEEILDRVEGFTGLLRQSTNKISD